MALAFETTYGTAPTSGFTKMPFASATLRQATQDVLDFGIAVSEQDAEQIERTNDALSRMALVWQGITNQLAVAAAPALEVLAEGFANLARRTGPLGQAIQFVFANLDRLVTYAATFAGFLAGRWVTGLAAAVLSVRGLATALVVLRGALIRTGIGALIVGAGELIYQFTKLSRGAGGVGEALSLLGDLAGEVWERMKLGLASLGARQAALFFDLKSDAASAMQSAIESLTAFANAAVNTFEGAYQAIKAIWGALPAAALAAGRYDAALEAASNAADGAAESVPGVARNAKEAVETIGAARTAATQLGRDAERVLETRKRLLSEIARQTRETRSIETRVAIPAPDFASTGSVEAVEQMSARYEDAMRAAEDVARTEAARAPLLARIAETVGEEKRLLEQQLALLDRKLAAEASVKDVARSAREDAQARLESLREEARIAERLADLARRREDAETQASPLNLTAIRSTDALQDVLTARDRLAHEAQAQAIRKTAEETKKLEEAERGAFESFAKGAANTLRSAKSIGEALSNIAKRLADLAFESALSSIFNGQDFGSTPLGKILGGFGRVFGGASAGGASTTGATGGGIGSVLGSIGSIVASFFHSGGVAGMAAMTRPVPAMAFAGAQRFHGGGYPGLRPDEVPAILQRGERVLSRRETRDYDRGQREAAPQVTITINAQDAESFRRSRTQIAADIARAVSFGRRGM